MRGGVILAASGIIAAGTAGFALGRRSKDINLKRLLKGNHQLLSRKDQKVVKILVQLGHQHVFNSWPPPGVRDVEKRHLLRAAADYLEGAVDALEPARLAVLQPPRYTKKPLYHTAHGQTWDDPYYWLRDDSRKDPEVLGKLKAENDYLAAVMAGTQELQDQLYKEMRGRIREDDVSVPQRYHGYYYYTRTLEGQQYKVHCRRKLPEGASPQTEADTLDESIPEEVLLDENKEAAKYGFYMVGAAEASPSHRLFAWTEDTVGGEKYALRVKDLSSGKEVMESVKDTSGEVVWASDNKTLFYVVKDKLDRPYKVLRHVIGTPASQDVVVYEEADESFYVDIQQSRSEQMILIHIASAVTSEVRYLRSDDALGSFQLLYPRENNVEYHVSHRGDHFFIVHRDPEKPNSELRVAPVKDPTKYQVLVAHSKDVKLEGIEVSQRHLALFMREQGLQRASIHPLPEDGSMPGTLPQGKDVSFEEPAYSLNPGAQGDFESAVLRLGYTSLTTPASTIDVHMDTGARAVKKVQPVLGGFDAAAYQTERLWATAGDGTKVPISLVYRKDLFKKDGTSPMLLNGYGAYEISNDPYFSSKRLSLVDRGFVFAIAHVRGGGEMGRYWYEDGKYLKKKNTFTDFIACAEHLVKERYSSPDRLCIEGRSAGGLLMGAVTNMRPDLFHAVIMGVPFVDARATMLDETIPLTVIEWEEWGNPKDSKEFFDYIGSYSPVDNVTKQLYPNILVTAGLHDPRVAYWEPAKLVARLRECKTDSNLLLVKFDMGAGHFSKSGRFEQLQETALEYAFLLKCVGVTHTPAAPVQAEAPKLVS